MFCQRFVAIRKVTLSDYNYCHKRCKFGELSWHTQILHAIKRNLASPANPIKYPPSIVIKTILYVSFLPI